MSSIIISLEGNSLTGKSTCVVHLNDFFVSVGANIIASREPGGTIEGELIRKEISVVRARVDLEEDTKTKIVLNKIYEARKLHLQKLIIPHIGDFKERNNILLLDRFIDSTFVYQYLENNSSAEYLALILKYNEEIVGHNLPDLTFLFYFPEESIRETLLERQRQSLGSTLRDVNIGDKSSFEEYLRRQQFYLLLPSLFQELGIKRNFQLIDATKTPNEILKEMVNTIHYFLEQNAEFRTCLNYELFKMKFPMFNNFTNI